MMRFNRLCFVLFVLFFLNAVFVFGQKTSVLWIGNSYVYTNDLPTTFYQLALSGGDTIVYDSNTPGGYTFEAHSTNATSLLKIGQGGWDYVVLQEQSQRPSFDPSQVAVEVLPYAKDLDSLIRAANPCGETVFFMTWGRKYGDAMNCASYPPVCTFEGMNNRLRESYLLMADDNDALMSPVGMAWKYSWNTDSTINLWSSDNSHPSIAGTYLNACVFYAVILRKNPVGLDYYSSLSPSDALYLQQIAWQTVNDSLSTWNIGVFDLISDFSVICNGTEVQFINESVNALTWFWDFGDGSSSVLPSPVHDYDQPGNYIVKHIVTNDCGSDTLIDTISVISTLLISSESISCVSVLPNPFDRELKVEFAGCPGPGGHAELVNLQGDILKIEPVTGSDSLVFDCSGLQEGVYFIRVFTTSGVYISRQVKIHGSR